MIKTRLTAACFMILTLTACSVQEPAAVPSASEDSMRPASVITLDEGVWPDNEYTEGLPVPPGTVEWAILDTEYKNLSIGLEDVGEDSYEAYMKLLEKQGYAVIQGTLEEIRGQDYISEMMLLSDGERYLSIGHIPGSLGLSISFMDGKPAGQTDSMKR